MMKKRRVAVVAILAALVAGVAGATTAASIPEPDGSIHACYDTNGGHKGDLTAIDVAGGQTCPAGSAALVWNQGYYSKTTAITPTVAGPASVAIDCDPGDTVISGGWDWPVFEASNFQRSRPSPTDEGKWEFTIYVPAPPSGATFNFYIRCADLT